MEAPSLALVLAFCLTLTPVAGCIGTGEEAIEDQSAPGPTSGDPIAFEKIHSPEEIADEVEEFGRLDGVDVQQIGTSLEGRPIQLVTVGEGDLETWIVGRQHGNEPTGAEAILLTIETLTDPDAPLPTQAPAILETLRQHRDTVLEEMTFHFVPVGNPDGAAAYQRGTATGQDPNRDHFAFTHPFSRALREAFWERRPDACLDLHNMGTGDTDFDAYGAEGPLMEEETYRRAVEDANLAVREVDAGGGNGGLYNENYRAPGPADEFPNPTAFHPGTHDVFCTARGAPGWTPEGAIEDGDNGAQDDIFAWSTRLHQVTVAAHALHWAGVYDASRVDVWKTGGLAEPTTEHTFTLEEPGELRLQTVWRQTDTPGDHNALPVRFTVTTPDGETHEGRMPHPEAWTSTVHLDEAEPGDYRLQLQGLSHATYEVRTYAQPETAPILDVQRTETGLELAASQQLDGTVRLEITDVFDPAEGEASSFTPAAETISQLDGTVGERLIAAWSLELEPGETVEIDEPEALEGQGPYRFTATDGERLHAGVEDALNPQPN